MSASMDNDAEHHIDASVAALDEAKELVAMGENVPVAIFVEWASKAREATKLLLEQSEARGDAAGIERIRVIQAMIDKQMRLIDGKGNDDEQVQ